MPIAKHVLQFRIALQGISPPIWRRILVPEHYTFWDFHIAIQSAMDGWEDYHLHLFAMRHPYTREMVQIGFPDREYDDILAGWVTPLRDYFGLVQRKATYEYDFGDGWLHNIQLEAILPVEKGVSYPQCLAGRRQCPPEDCGGPPGFSRFLEANRDPKHPEHDEMAAWFGGPFDPDDFSPGQVIFDDPELRWRYAFLEEAGGVAPDQLVQPTRVRRIGER